MKSIFDHTNPAHIKILREELLYVKNLLREDANKNTRTLIRGILNMIADNGRYENTAQVREMLKNELNSVDSSINSIEIALNALATYNANAIIQIQSKLGKMLKSKTSQVWRPATGGTDASVNRDWRGGSWTGD